MQRLAARDEDLGVGRPGQERRDRRRGLDDLLEVVDEHEQPLVRDVVDQAVVGADRCSDRALDEGRVAERLERNPEDTVGELLDRFGSELEREARLAASARSGQRDQAMRAHERAGLLELALPADERRRLDRQVRSKERLQRREVFVAELVQTLRVRSGP